MPTLTGLSKLDSLVEEMNEFDYEECMYIGVNAIGDDKAMGEVDTSGNSLCDGESSKRRKKVVELRKLQKKRKRFLSMKSGRAAYRMTDIVTARYVVSKRWGRLGGRGSSPVEIFVEIMFGGSGATIP